MEVNKIINDLILFWNYSNGDEYVSYESGVYKKDGSNLTKVTTLSLNNKTYTLKTGSIMGEAQSSGSSSGDPFIIPIFN